MGLSWGYSLRVASLPFSHPLIHTVHCTILYANKFQVISTDNSRGKIKQNLSVRTLSLRNFVCTPAVIHSALDCFLTTSSYLFLYIKWKKHYFGYIFSNYRFYPYHTRNLVLASGKLVAQEMVLLDVIFIQTLTRCIQSREDKQKI